MKKISFISAVLSVCMLISTTAFADFSDMPKDAREKAAIEHAVANGILSGYEDGTVRPGNYITRAEMASIITRACGATKSGDVGDFYDLNRDSWYYPAFEKAYYMGVFHGDGEGRMYPESNITFQETFTILSQVFDLLPSYTRSNEAPDPLPENTVYVEKNARLYDVSILNSRGDTAGTANWAKVFVAGLIEYGACDGITIAPTEYITRAQFAIVLDNIIQNYIDTPGTYDSLPAGNTMIRCDGVILDNASTESDIFVADGVGQAMLKLNGVTAKRLVVRGCATPVNSEMQLENEAFGLVVNGTFDEIRIICPFIVADLTDAVYGKLYTAYRTSVNLATIIQQ